MVVMSKKNARIFISIYSILFVLSIVVLIFIDPYALRESFDDISSYLTISLNILQLLAVYSYAYEKHIFENVKVVTLILFSVPSLSAFTLKSDLYDQWEFISRDYIFYNALSVGVVTALTMLALNALRMELTRENYS